MSRPIVLVTGANGGVGLGVCERLLVQLSTPTPPDSTALYGGREDAAGTPFDAGNGCTLILACRNEAKARAAIEALEALLQKLHDQVDDDLPERAGSAASSAVDAPSKDGLRTRQFTNDRSAPLAERNAVARTEYRRRFARNSKIEFVKLDLASVASTKACAQKVLATYPHLTHLILNAGGAAWAGVNWPLAFFEIITNLHRGVTRPSYKLQNPSETTADGFGWVWEINCGMHYVLANELVPLMRKSPYKTPSRIIWTGSLEASQCDYHPEDFQCLDPKVSPHAYESTKYQCELAALGMDERLAATHEHAPRVYTAHPGIVASSIFAEVIHVVLLSLMKLVFYVVRRTTDPGALDLFAAPPHRRVQRRDRRLVRRRRSGRGPRLDRAVRRAVHLFRPRVRLSRPDRRLAGAGRRCARHGPRPRPPPPLRRGAQRGPVA